MKLLFLCVALSAVFPQNPAGQNPTSGSSCGCGATWSQDASNVAAECGAAPGSCVPPIIVPSNQTTTNGDCNQLGGDCETKPRSTCAGSVDVQVTWPASGTSCANKLWIQGGSTYPVPTLIVSNSSTATLKLAAACKADGAGTTSRKTFKVWCTEPQSEHEPPSASYTFTLNCDQCGGLGTSSATPQSN